MPSNTNAAPYPSWYQPETPDEIARAGGVDPSWDKYDPLPSKTGKATAQNGTQPAPQGLDPSWNKYDPPPPAWYTPDPDATPAQNAPTPAPDSPWQDVRSNLLTGVARVPGAILGVPKMVADGVDYLTAKAMGVPTADVAAGDGLQSVLPSSDAIDSDVFNATGMKPYTPQTMAGRVGQAFVTGAGAGLVDPAADIGAARNAWRLLKGLAGNAAKTGLAAGTAEGSQEVFPNTPALAAATAFATHGGLNAASATAGRALNAAGRQIFRPTRAGQIEAAGVLENGVDNSAPGIAQPSDADLASAAGNVAGATGTFYGGLEPWQAGSQLRDSLQGRVNSLEDARTTATAPLLAARDSSPNTIGLSPVLATIGQKLATAAGPQAQAITDTLGDLRLPNGNIRTQADQLAASRQAINARISAATRAGDGATAAHLFDIRNALDTQINAAVPEAGQYNQTFADYSRPLDPTEYGPVGQVLDRDQFNSRYTFPDERIPDLFLRGPATRSNVNQLVSAFGGDNNAALGALEQHLAGVASGAVNPDGTLDTDAFNRVMAPYQKAMNGNVGMFFPSLTQKFNSAKAAQATLDTMNAQRGIADSVANGGLRDTNGAITAQSFGNWMNANRKALTQSQPAGAVMRLDQIANALKARQGELADALKSEMLPAAAGLALGGTDGGIIGIMASKTGKYLYGGLGARRQAAFNAAIENAVRDPASAAKLATEMGKRARYMSPARALVQSAFATVPATIAGTGVPQPPPGADQDGQ